MESTVTSEARPAAKRGRVAPAPPPARFFGWRGNAIRFFRDPLTFLTGLRETHGPVVRLAEGGNGPLFAGTDAAAPATFFAFGGECNRQVLSDGEIFQTRVPPGPATRAYELISTNILFINGERHTHLRQLLRPAFTRESLKKYHRHMVAYAAQMLDGWKGSDRIDAHQETLGVALRIASKCFYGIDPSGREGSLGHLMHRMVNTLFSPAAVLKINLPGTPYRRLILTMEQIVEALSAEIENKRAAGGGEDLLSVLVREHDRDPTQLTEEELFGNAFVLFLGGHETTSTGLVWTLLLLAQHPRVAADLLDELDGVLGGEPPAYEQIYELPLLDRVIKESLRLLPPGIFFPRVATRATEIGGYEVPAGCEVVYSPYVTHRDPQVFSEPKRFLPDRWLEMKPTPFEYLPFGARARTCMGLAFAGMQLRTVLPMILQRYRPAVVPGARIDVKSHTVMSPRGPVPMTLHPQDRDFRRSPGLRGMIREIVDFS